MFNNMNNVFNPGNIQKTYRNSKRAFLYFIVLTLSGLAMHLYGVFTAAGYCEYGLSNALRVAEFIGEEGEFLFDIIMMFSGLVMMGLAILYFRVLKSQEMNICSNGVFGMGTSKKILGQGIFGLFNAKKAFQITYEEIREVSIKNKAVTILLKTSSEAIYCYCENAKEAVGMIHKNINEIKEINEFEDYPVSISLDPLHELPDINDQDYYLESLDGKVSFRVPVGRIKIGRSYELWQYLASKTSVSRVHAELVFVNGVLSISNLNSTNGTYINHRKLESGTAIALYDNDEIELGDAGIGGRYCSNAAYFRVKVV